MTWDKFLTDLFAYSWDMVGVALALTIMFGLWKAHADPKYDTINLLDLMLDHDTHRLSDSKFRLNIAFLLTSFVLIYLTLNGKLTEWYVTSFLGAWVIDRWGSRNASVEYARSGVVPKAAPFLPKPKSACDTCPENPNQSLTQNEPAYVPQPPSGIPKHRNPTQPGTPGLDEG